MFTKNLICSTVLVAGGLLTQMSAMAAPFVLDFEGAGNFANINDFYNGGTDSYGNSGVDYGIQFSFHAVSLIDVDAIDEDAGVGGNFANEPTPDTIMFFLTGTAILNFAPGFDTGFSFFYSSSTAATVNVYDGLNGTGNLIGSLDLAAQYTENCTGDPNGLFCNWTAIGVAFAGTAKSIDFGGTVDQTGYDDITFGSVDPGEVPEPASLALLGLGLAGFSFLRRRKT